MRTKIGIRERGVFICYRWWPYGKLEGLTAVAREKGQKAEL
jgi:hypothetical protein